MLHKYLLQMLQSPSNSYAIMLGVARKSRKPQPVTLCSQYFIPHIPSAFRLHDNHIEKRRKFYLMLQINFIFFKPGMFAIYTIFNMHYNELLLLSSDVPSF